MSPEDFCWSFAFFPKMNRTNEAHQRTNDGFSMFLLLVKPRSTASAYFRMRDTLSPASAWSDTVKIVCRVKPWKKPCA